MVEGWVLSKCDDTPGGPVPLVHSLSTMWRAAVPPPSAGGWTLVHVRCHQAVVDYIKQDADFIWIGSEWSKVPQELITTFADILPGKGNSYANFGQVLDDLASANPRFNLRAFTQTS